MPKDVVGLNKLTILIPGLPPGLAGLRIAQVTDFHFRRWNGVMQAARNILESLEYDLLVTTGDFVDVPHLWATAVELTRRFFEPLVGRAPIYAVLGNHDDPRLAAAPEMPLTFLRNESVVLELRGTPVRLVGIEQSIHGGEDIEAALGAGPRGVGLTILLAHFPSTVFRIPADAVDLVLSGHTHGGQVRIPVLGCLWANDRIPLRLARGLHRIGSTWLHTSAGIGVSPPIRVRILCPPQVDLLELQPAEGDFEADRRAAGPIP